MKIEKFGRMSSNQTLITLLRLAMLAVGLFIFLFCPVFGEVLNALMLMFVQTTPI